MLDKPAEQRKHASDALMAASVEGAAPTLHGNLRKKSFIKLLFELAVVEESGLLVLRSGAAVKGIYLVNGDPRFITSNQADELFGQYLVGKGVIAKGELSMALAMLPHFDGKLGDALVSLKLLRPMEVIRHLTQQVRQKLLDSFGWDEGTYAFYRGKEPAQESAPLGLDAFELMGRAVNTLSFDVLQGRLTQIVQRVPRAVSPPPLPPEVFRLGSLPRQAYDKLQGKLSVGGLLEQFDDGNERNAFARVLYLLVETGLANLA
jgi:hypothetical protein